VLVDKQVGFALPREAKHAVIKVLNPSANGFTIAQLDGHRYLPVAERAKVERLLAGLARRRGLGTSAGRQWRSHMAILDACPGFEGYGKEKPDAQPPVIPTRLLIHFLFTMDSFGSKST
jgi:hypothetical protein